MKMLSLAIALLAAQAPAPAPAVAPPAAPTGIPGMAAVPGRPNLLQTGVAPVPEKSGNAPSNSSRPGRPASSTSRRTGSRS